MSEAFTRTPLVGARGQLAASATDIYTAPTGNSKLPVNVTDLVTAYVRQIILCNTDTATRTFTLYAVESGGSTAANRALFSAVTIAAGQTVELPYDQDQFGLAGGEKLRGLADSASKVTYRVNVDAILYTQ